MLLRGTEAKVLLMPMATMGTAAEAETCPRLCGQQVRLPQTSHPSRSPHPCTPSPTCKDPCHPASLHFCSHHHRARQLD